MGEQTFGKGVVQYYFPINNDGGVKLTVAKYLTPHRCETPDLCRSKSCSSHTEPAHQPGCLAHDLTSGSTECQAPSSVPVNTSYMMHGPGSKPARCLGFYRHSIFADDISKNGGLQPDVSCSDFPKGGASVSPDNDACIKAAVDIIQQSPPAQPVPSTLFARTDIAALALVH